MTTAPVVFVGDADLSVRSSPNQPAIKICWMLFASYCRKIGRDARASKGRYPRLSRAGDAFLHASRVVGVVPRP